MTMAMMPFDQNSIGGLFGLGQGGDASNLVSNPLFMAGLGLLSAGRDRRIDPFQAGAQGLLSANQIQQTQADADMRRQQFGFQKQKFDYEQQRQQRVQEAQEKVRGLLEAGDTQGAARLALTSGDPSLGDFGRGLLTPQKPASIQELEYLQQHPELQGPYEKLQAMGRPQTPYKTPIQTGDGWFSYDNRTGLTTPMFGANGKPLLSIPADIDLAIKKAQGVAAATEVGKQQGSSEAMGTIAAPNALDLLGQAEKAISNQPASAAGRAYETGLGYFGLGNNTQQKAMAEADTIGAQLMAYANKLPGPASDADRIDFKASVGTYANPSATREQRLAAVRKAMQHFQNLQAKYGGGSQPSGAKFLGFE